MLLQPADRSNSQLCVGVQGKVAANKRALTYPGEGRGDSVENLCQFGVGFATKQTGRSKTATFLRDKFLRNPEPVAIRRPQGPPGAFQLLHEVVGLPLHAGLHVLKPRTREATTGRQGPTHSHLAAAWGIGGTAKRL